MDRHLVSDLFTRGEINRASIIFGDAKEHHAHARVVHDIVEPALARINKKTKQENDPRYLAYLLEAAIENLRPRPKPERTVGQ